MTCVVVVVAPAIIVALRWGMRERAARKHRSETD
jgi:hypothetical protein